MTPCPTCQQPVELQDKHWGTLFTCPHCNSVFFVDWNGQPEVAQHDPDSISSEFEFTNQSVQNIMPDAGADFNASPAEAVPFVESTDNAVSESWNQTGVESESWTSSGEDLSEGISFTEQPIAEVPVEPQFELPDSEDPVTETEPPLFDQTLDQQLHQSTGAGLTAESSDLSEISNFANSDQLSGPISYEVRIQGIDSSHLAMELKEAMTDSRFAWDASALILSIEYGTLVLPGLSPAKASVLINRIKYLPFKISWRQDVLASS